MKALLIFEDSLIILNQKKSGEGFASRGKNYIEYISEGDNNRNLSPKEYLKIIRSYLIYLINHHKASGE